MSVRPSTYVAAANVEIERLLEQVGGWSEVYKRCPEIHRSDWDSMKIGEVVKRLSELNKRPTPVVELQGEGKPIIVRGRKLPPLPPVQYSTLALLIQAGEAGLSKGELETNLVGSDGVKAIDRILKRDGFEDVIIKPGKAFGRYRIRMENR